MSDSNNTSSSNCTTPLVRYITDTDDNGNSFFANVSSSVPVSLDLGQGASISIGYFVNNPGRVNMTDAQDLDAYENAVSSNNFPPAWPTNGGNTLIFVDTPPGATSELHRTQSLDYTIQILGEIILTLSNGDTRLIKPGDVVIQRGTLHKWTNPSTTQTSRFLGVNNGALPLVTKNNGSLPVIM